MSGGGNELANQPSQKELRKIYQRKSRPVADGGQSASRVARNGARSGIGHNDTGDNVAANDDEYE